MSADPGPAARGIALDVGGTSVKSAILAPGGRVIGAPSVTPIDSAGTAPAIVGALAHIIAGHLEALEPARVAGIALGFPGPFDYAAGICRITGVEKYEALFGLDLRRALRQKLGRGDLPICFRNDAEAAIVGEACYGAGRRFRRLIGVTLGTGFGSAFVVDGAPVTAGPGVPANGWLYPLRFHGVRADDCFSRRGLVARLQAAGLPLGDVKPAAESARGGDAAARGVFAAFGADLGTFLNPIAAEFQAEAVVVGGQIAGAFDLFGAALQGPLTVPARAGERAGEAALLGAAQLLFNQ